MFDVLSWLISKSGQSRFIVSDRQVPQEKLSKAVWSKPLADGSKINCDGTFGSETKRAGIGMICRDSEGRVLDGLEEKICVDAPGVAEAVAIFKRTGIELLLKRAKK